MSRTVVVAILGLGVAVIVPLVTAATYVGALTERVNDVETWMNQDDQRTDQAFDAFVSAARLPGSEIGFSNDGPWGAWSDSVFCPQSHYVCGLKQKVQAPVASGDEVGVAGVAFYCCPLDSRTDRKP